MPHPRIDEFEKRLIEKDQQPREIARRLSLPHAEVVKALLDVGLEVEGRVKPGLESTLTARYRGTPLDYTPRHRRDSTVASRRAAHIAAVIELMEDHRCRNSTSNS